MQEKFMKEALKEAKKAFIEDEVPIGAVIVYNNKVISRGHNQKEQKQDTTKHAEIIAIQKASKKLKNWRLDDCDIYVTVEPCAMCMGAILEARLKNIYIGTMDEKIGACGSKINLTDYNYNNTPSIYKDILKDECKKYMQDFFKKLRGKNHGCTNSEKTKNN